jgi:hypothetical protein
MKQVDGCNSIAAFLTFCGVAILLLICTLEILAPFKLSIPIRAENNKVHCVLPEACLKVEDYAAELKTEGWKVSLKITNFHNLFDLKRDLESVSFYLSQEDRNNFDKSLVSIRPVIKYRAYSNSQEITGTTTGYFILPLKIPADYEIVYTIDGTQPKSLSDISIPPRTGRTWWVKILPNLNKRMVFIFSNLALLTSLLLFFMLAVSMLLEWRKNRVDDTTSNLFITSIVRPVFLILFIFFNPCHFHSKTQ